MVASLAQETILLKYKNLLPDKINSKWLDYAARQRLLNNSTALDRYYSFKEFLEHVKEKVEWNFPCQVQILIYHMEDVDN